MPFLQVPVTFPLSYLTGCAIFLCHSHLISLMQLCKRTHDYVCRQYQHHWFKYWNWHPLFCSRCPCGYPPIYFVLKFKLIYPRYIFGWHFLQHHQLGANLAALMYFRNIAFQPTRNIIYHTPPMHLHSLFQPVNKQ